VRAALLSAAFIVSACATPDGGRYEAPNKSLGRLTSGTLNPGECGLFVWRKDEAKTFLILSSARKARIYVDKEYEFTPNEDPLATEQEFAANDRDWTLRLTSPKPIAGGTRYDAGTLKTTTDGGWELIVSVIGLTMCNQDPVSS